MSKTTPEPPAAVDGWVWMRHPDIEGDPVRVPDDPTVIAHQEARGWGRTEAPEEPLSVVPDPGPQLPPGAEDDGWVELEHADLKVRHRFPADPAAIELAGESGWRLPEAPQAPDAGEDEAKPAKKRASSKPATDSTEE